MTRLSRKGLSIVTVTGFLLAGSCLAQAEDAHHPPAKSSPGMMTPMMGGGMMGSGGMPMMGMMGGGMMPMMGMYPDGSAAFLKTELKITTAQEAVWTAYASALKDFMQQHQQHMSAMMMGGAGAAPRGWIERLTDSEAKISAHLQAVKKIRPAAEALYAALSAEQKQKADALMPGGMGMGMGGMR